MRITQDGLLMVGGDMEAYCVYILMQMQKGLCDCGAELLKGFQIAHKRYGVDITIHDIELKCGACHAKEHGKKSHQGLLRTKM